jgi:hypothetical protein
LDALALAAMIGVSTLSGGDVPSDGVPGWTCQVEMRTDDSIKRVASGAS